MEANPVPSPRPEDPTVPPPGRKRFLGPFLFWMFCFALPASVAINTLRIYIHEFSHGLSALALGGYFLGIKMQPSTRQESTMAYADAWSEGHQNIVLLAGIAVNVLLGALLLRKAFRCDRLVPRLLLFIAAGSFLSEIEYALEGCIFWNSDFDTAMALQSVGSAGLRWTCLIALLPPFVLSIAVVGRGLLRTWERVFGALSGGKAFWVVLLLGEPIPVPSIRDSEAWPAWLGAGVGYVVFVTWLLRTRQRTLEPTPTGRFMPWGIGLVLSTILATVGLVLLYKGIYLGTYPDLTVYDLHPDRSAVVGISARYGMGNREGRNREAHDPKVFVSTPEGPRLIPSPTGQVLDVAWLSDLDRVVVVGWNGIYEVDGRSGKQSVVWEPPSGWIERAAHGPHGQVLAVLRNHWGKLELLPGLYVYDAARSFGEFHDAKGHAGNPIFLQGVSVRAAVTIGDDLWEVTWPDDDDGEILVERREGHSKGGGWFEGLSGGSAWWYDGKGWISGSTRVLNKDISRWAAGPEGLFTLKDDGGWSLAMPETGRSRQGSIDTSSVKLLRILDGEPWVAFRNGEVRRLEDNTPSFRVRYPLEDR